ncbi:MAG: DUF4167 domain-containing protein, partial [Aestuariivirgaceae bacterium]
IVMSESYYQHAEHYMRIIAANQSQKEQQQQQQRVQETAAGTGPQPSEHASGDEAKAEAGNVEAKTNGEAAPDAGSQDDGDAVSFDGDLPQFLKGPADDEPVAEKPKRARRSSSRSKPAAAKDDGADDADAAPSSGDEDGSGETPSDAEVVAS